MVMGPIPGQSLTQPPGAAQYERPPKHSKPEEALEEYIDRLEDPDKREDLLTALELGTPITTLVTVLTREGTRKGFHSVDTAVILRPMLHEYIKTLGKAAGIKVKESPTEGYDVKERKRKEKLAMQAKVAMAMSKSSQQPEEEILEEPTEPELEPETPQEPEQKGIMTRRSRA